ncbi:hypothetical protein A5904_05885 [Acidithiobacillus caldus]|jgi:hypothetical protein|uniref:hypothetical protein n=1 Tax=Acidithiobacillus caldus TaxID=33059 RepID=UPI0007D8D041|nr:hypothetical protein [Acidithiobacillus caldus]AUW32551.1 hypothetical protein A5904_05885 [Acidithiobacillus caldus]MBU2802261.1 hypothetical protein [Acidithiobacillus caldus]QER45361.1 hypothetical protein F0726_02304 [Acidithiobacillus caldus]WMT47850.1 MAG: hypothetical protein RE468_04360 [Acidithiobacillus caldus]
MEIQIVIEDNLPLAEASRIVRSMASTIGWDVEWNGDHTFQLRIDDPGDVQEGFGLATPIADIPGIG